MRARRKSQGRMVRARRAAACQGLIAMSLEAFAELSARVTCDGPMGRPALTVVVRDAWTWALAPMQAMRTRPATGQRDLSLSRDAM
jgi:hypothetical protein